MISSRTRARLVQAFSDAECAMILMAHEKWFESCLLMQQAAEKIIQAHLIHAGCSFPTRSLQRLQQALFAQVPDLAPLDKQHALALSATLFSRTLVLSRPGDDCDDPPCELFSQEDASTHRQALCLYFRLIPAPQNMDDELDARVLAVREWLEKEPDQC